MILALQFSHQAQVAMLGIKSTLSSLAYMPALRVSRTSRSPQGTWGCCIPIHPFWNIEMCRNACKNSFPSLEGNLELTPAILHGPVWVCITSS